MTTNLQRLLGLGGWNVSMLSHDGANRRNMLLLIQLRWLAVAGQVATILLVHYAMRIPLPLFWLLVAPAGLVLVNLISAPITARRSDADGSGQVQGPDPRQQTPPDVPVDVLALPGRHLDRRLHLRLSAGHAAMTADNHAPEAHHDHHGHDDHDHGSFKSYMIGFVLSVILTAIPFALVMTGALPAQATALIVMAFAVVQIVVHMIYFLHMNTKSEGGWNMLALIFTIVIVFICLAGSLWVMHHLNTNMMPTHDMTQMVG